MRCREMGQEVVKGEDGMGEEDDRVGRYCFLLNNIN